jgi:hypothetical protein
MLPGHPESWPVLYQSQCCSCNPEPAVRPVAPKPASDLDGPGARDSNTANSTRGSGGAGETRCVAVISLITGCSDIGMPVPTSTSCPLDSRRDAECEQIADDRDRQVARHRYQCGVRSRTDVDAVQSQAAPNHRCIGVPCCATTGKEPCRLRRNRTNQRNAPAVRISHGSKAKTRRGSRPEQRPASLACLCRLRTPSPADRAPRSARTVPSHRAPRRLRIADTDSCANCRRTLRRQQLESQRCRR